MKRLLLSIALFFALNLLFAHIDRPIDALIFDGKTYDAYGYPLESFVKNDRDLKRVLLTNPVNTRIPKHYYATYEIKDKKLYLNKIELIVISVESMRNWRFPLSLDYELKEISAEKLFGKGATYPIFCDWYSGRLIANIFDGETNRRFLFEENSLFDFKDGNFLEKRDLSTRSILTNTITLEESHLLPKMIANRSFGTDKLTFDLRCVANRNFFTYEEFSTLADSQAFKTRGYLGVDKKKRLHLYVQKTRTTQAQRLSLMTNPSLDMGDFKQGDRVEATIFFPNNSYSRAGLLSLRHLADDEIIHSPDFFFRIRSK